MSANFRKSNKNELTDLVAIMRESTPAAINPKPLCSRAILSARLTVASSFDVDVTYNRFLFLNNVNTLKLPYHEMHRPLPFRLYRRSFLCFRYQGTFLFEQEDKELMSETLK